MIVDWIFGSLVPHATSGEDEPSLNARDPFRCS